ncbi:MAG: septal ring factor EnvC (AmiA/AmiB activator) [Candidatus Krumholzibacteriia bacterium]|jgi:septal ring factor EnvC (AmiA/AmiB activator)
MMAVRGVVTRRLMISLVMLLLVQSPLLAEEGEKLQHSIQENTQKLADLRARMKEQQDRIVNIDDQRVAVRRSHDEIQKEIEISQQLLSDTVNSELQLTTQSEQLARDVGERRSDYDFQKQALAQSLRNMYLRGQRGEMEMLITAGSFSDLMTRMKISRMMARMEAGVVDRTREDGARLQREQRLLDAALAEIWQAREEKSHENDRLELLMAEQVASLRELEDEKSGIKNRMLDLSLNEQKLNYILDDLEQQRTEVKTEDTEASAASLAAMAGQLEWPVRGELLRGFGRSVHPKFQTITVNNGFNIAAGVGAPVAAVAEGVVEFSDQLPGFGQCVILDHGAGYYSLYAHLDRMFVDKGDQIARGQVMAEVGRPSGSEEPQLYFEMRQGRTPLDPGDWLKPR